jgi:hypothetical protein
MKHSEKECSRTSKVVYSKRRKKLMQRRLSNGSMPLTNGSGKKSLGILLIYYN